MGVWIEPGASTLTFGAGSLGPTAATRYLFPGYVDALAKTIEYRARPGREGVIQGVFVETLSPGPGGATVTMTVRVNGANTAMAVTYDNALSSAAEVSPNFWVKLSVNDVVSVMVTKSGPATPPPRDVVVTVLIGES